MDPNTAERRENWELSKENIQPLSSGRRLEYISDTLCSMANEEQEAKIHSKLRMFENSIKDYDGDDPLDPWIRYITFVEQAFIGGSETKWDVIKRCVAQFIGRPEYKNDKRFVEIFVKSVATMEPDCRIGCLKQALLQGQIGTTASRMYLTIAEDYEAVQQYTKAVEILNTGIKEKAVPIEYLQDALKQLHYRVAEKIFKGMNENTESLSGLRSFGDSVPIHGPDNDAPSIRMHLPPADPTQSKPVTKKDMKHVDVYADSNGVSENGKLVNGGMTLFSNKDDKENNLEPTKWNKKENTIAVGQEFVPPSRPQNPIQLYVDEAEEHVVGKKSRPVEGVLSDRTEKPEFKRPKDVAALPNVKICYRKSQLMQNGMEISFEHLRAAEYRKRLLKKAETAAESNSDIIEELQDERNKKAVLLAEIEDLKKQLQEKAIELKQHQEKATREQSMLLQKLAATENDKINLEDLEAENKRLKNDLHDLEESYHALKRVSDSEKDNLLQEICHLKKSIDLIFTDHERERALAFSKAQVDMANWKSKMSDDIRKEEENRLRKEFEIANKVMVAKYEADLSNMLAMERQRYDDLERKYGEQKSLMDSVAATKMSESIQNNENSNAYADVVSLGTPNQSTTTLASMYSTSYPYMSLPIQNGTSNSISSNNYFTLGSTGDAPTSLSISGAKTATENYSSSTSTVTKSVEVPVKSNPFLEPKVPRPFKAITKLMPASKKAPAFSLYESHGETLNQGDSILQDFSQKSAKSIDYHILPENIPFQSLNLVNDENKVVGNIEERKPLQGVLTPRAAFSAPEVHEEEDFVCGAPYNEKTMDFNITNNLTRALAMDRPLLVSTPDHNEKGFQRRRKSLGRIRMADTSVLQHEASVYVAVGDYDEDEVELDGAGGPHNRLNFTEAPVIQNLSTIQETSKENRSTYTTSSSSGSNMTNTNMTRGFASLNNFTRSGSITASSKHYGNQSHPYFLQTESINMKPNDK